MTTRLALITAIALGGALAAPAVANADCFWSIRGRLAVDDNIGVLDGSTHPIRNARVEVSGSAYETTGYGAWAEDVTEVDGSFVIGVFKPCKKRWIKIKVRFKDDDLDVQSKPTGEHWSKVYQAEHSVRSIDVGTLTFEDGVSNQDLGRHNHYRRAFSWMVMREVIDRLVAEDPRFAYNGRINIVYPATVVSRASYANGTTRTAYIHRDAWRDSWHPLTVVHEAMHLWNYDHNSGMSDWFAAIQWDFSTHSFQEDRNIAFHEGFSNWAASALIEELWGGLYGLSGSPDPLSFWSGYDFTTRTYLDDMGLSDHDTVQGNEWGVAYALKLMTLGDYYPNGLAMLGRRCPIEPRLEIWDLFTVFLADASAGWTSDWQVNNPLFGVLRFYDRAEDILGMEREHIDYMRSLLDASSDEVADDFCTISTLAIRR